MPYARRYRSRKPVRRSRKSFSRKRTSRKPARRYSRKPTRKSSRKSVKSRRPLSKMADTVGARLLATQTTDPGLLGMYRSAIQAGTSLSAVHVKARTAIADVYTCKFKWVTVTVPGTTPGTPLAWYGNSIIDCGRGIDNSDCAYVPELGAIYLYYRVTSSRCTLHMRQINSSDALTVFMFCTIIPPAQWATALPTTMDGWLTSGIPHKSHNLLPNNGCDRQIGSMSMFMKTSALFNSDCAVEDFSGLMPNTAVGQTGAPPATAFQWYWGSICFNYDGSAASTGQLVSNISVEYWTTLDGPVTSSEYTPGPSVPDASDLAALAALKGAASVAMPPCPPAPLSVHPTQAAHDDLEESVYVKLPRSSLKKS